MSVIQTITSERKVSLCIERTTAVADSVPSEESAWVVIATPQKHIILGSSNTLQQSSQTNDSEMDRWF